MRNRTYLCGLLFCTLPGMAVAQPTPDMQKILTRLDLLEQENHKLLEEIQDLRRELSQGTVAERVDVAEKRIDELAQTKVEASQRLPISVTGMLLFNAFENGAHGGGAQYPVVAGLTASPVEAGASLQQTILGLKFDGPDLPGGGKVSGNIYMDFFGGYSNYDFRLRTAMLDLAWKNTTISFGQDKPIFSPRDPDSLAQVGYSPLTGAGNLWDWQPQVRLEQRFSFGDDAGLRAQAGVYETAEYDASAPAVYQNTLENARPGYEGRFDFWHGKEDGRFEIAPGFHVSQTHVAGTSVPSRILSLDGLWKPLPFLQFTGAFFHGENVANTGALPDSFTILPSGTAIPVHAAGGWAQAAIFATPRLTFHFYGGEQRNRAGDLEGSGIGRNFVYAGNLVYRLGTNVLASFEASQARTLYLNSGIRLNNHYDLALAYLF
jgi:hypothetical protein